MLTLTDCIHFSDLTADELDAFAENRHIPAAIACGEAQQLSSDPRGCRTILRHLLERIESAEAHQDWDRSRQLYRALDHFAATHRYL